MRSVKHVLGTLLMQIDGRMEATVYDIDVIMDGADMTSDRLDFVISDWLQ